MRPATGTADKIETPTLKILSWNDQLQKLQAKNTPVDFEALWKMAGLTGYKKYRGRRKNLTHADRGGGGVKMALKMLMSYMNDP